MAGFSSGTGVFRSKGCERTRSLISLQLDQKLSELESRMLEAHLARCDDCSAFDLGARRVTATIRGQPLVPFEQPISVTRRRSFARLASLAAARGAAGAVCAARTAP